MSRHDDDLQGIARDRLHAVASRRVPSAVDPWAAARPDGAPPEDAAAAGAPERPVGAPPPPADPQAGDLRADAQDVVARVRAEALAAASATYASAHGHPLDRVAGAHRRRWYLSLRHALVAGAAVTVLAVGVVVRAVVSVPDAPLATTSVTAEDRAAGEPAGEGPADPRPPAADPAAGSPDAVPPGAAGESGVGKAAGTAPAGRVVVHVVGQVGRPGVVELPPGSRVADALAVAGGATTGADLAAVNLARVLTDGEQIVVPAPGEVVAPEPGPATAGPPAGAPGAAAAPPAAGAAGTAAPVDLNAAGLADLDRLPGIGPVLAQRILDFRAANGPFRHVEELGAVSGIGDALLARLAPRVRV